MLQTPTPTAIAAKINLKNGRFNGHESLVDAFLDVLPSSVKEEKNDQKIESLYSDVKRCLFATRTSFVVQQNTQHWALM